MSLKIIRNILLILILVVISYSIGYKVGYQHFSNTFSKNNFPTILNKDKTSFAPTIDFSLFWEVWERLSRNYIKKDALDPEKMFYGAISGMVSSLDDPYTVFLTPKQNKETKEELGGSFEGIGAQLGLKDKKIVVIAPLSGTPAEKMGIKSGDWIIEIEGKSTEGLSLPEAVSKIRGPKGSIVKLKILHDKEDKPLDLEITRDTILVKSVEWSIKKTQNNKSIAHLKLTRFGDETEKEWDLSINQIKDQINTSNISGLILDLRNNPGGYLSGSVYIASEFLKNNDIVVQQENANGDRQNYLVERNGKLLDIPLVILINKGSASASEIVAGAVSVHKRGKLVGEKTFGKGSIQEAQELPQGAGLHITTAKWLLPNGKWINGTGLEPDIKVVMDEKNIEKDPPLETALEILSK